MGTWLDTIANVFGLTKPASSPHPSVVTTQCDPMAVLAIDDDAEFLEMIRFALASYGYQVYTAASGPKGLNILANAPENLRVMVLDYQMPGFDGADTLYYARRLRGDLKIIGLTGTEYHQLPLEYRNGVDKILFKPFRMSELMSAIEEVTASPLLPLSPPSSAEAVASR